MRRGGRDNQVRVQCHRKVCVFQSSERRPSWEGVRVQVFSKVARRRRSARVVEWRLARKKRLSMWCLRAASRFDSPRAGHKEAGVGGPVWCERMRWRVKAMMVAGPSASESPRESMIR